MQSENEIIVYWCTENKSHFLNYEALRPVISELKSENFSTDCSTFSDDFMKCPAVIDHSRNRFYMPSPVDMKITWNGSQVTESVFDSDFIKTNTIIRDSTARFFSLGVAQYVFFASESLIAEQTAPFYSDTELSRATNMIHGEFDIGKWFRPMDSAFMFKKDFLNREITIRRHEPLFYIKFHTNKKIIFKRFIKKPEFDFIQHKVVSAKKYHGLGKVPLLGYLNRAYKDFERSKLNTYTLKEIQKNLME